MVGEVESKNVYPKITESLVIAEDTEVSQVRVLSILAGNYEFIGPFTDTAPIAAKAGIMAVFVEEAKGSQLVDLYESEDLFASAKTEFARQLETNEKISVAVHYAAELSIEELRNLKYEIALEFSDTEGNT